MTNTGHWVGPLDPFNPEADMVTKAGPPNATNSFSKAEGMVTGPAGNSVTFNESGAGADPDGAGDLFIMEDNSATDFGRGPTGNVNQVWVLPRGQQGAENLILFEQTKDEPTGPWFSNDNHLLYLLVQAESPRVSHVIAIRAPRTFNQLYDR